MRNVQKKKEKKQPKKILQFFIGGYAWSKSSYGSNSSGESWSKSSTKVWALCDDGTLWSKQDDGTAEALWVPEAVL